VTVLTLKAGHEVAGRYLLREPIGGGMGVVRQAWDETLKRIVAVKCARPDDEHAARRLRKEAQYAARLHHPNVVPVFDFVEEAEPLTWRQTAAQLADVHPGEGWTDKRVEHLVNAVRLRLSRDGVPGLTREEVGQPVGNALNDHLIRALLTSTSLVPMDLAVIDGA
jgi:hypothetical protein